MAATRVPGTLMSSPVGGVALLDAEGKEVEPVDPLTLGPITGNPRIEVSLSGTALEGEKVTGLGFVMVKDYRGDDVKAYAGDFIVYYQEPDPLAPDPNRFYGQVISAKYMDFLEGIGVATVPLTEGEEAAREARQHSIKTIEEEAPLEADEAEDAMRLVFEKYRWTGASAQGFIPKPDAPLEPPPVSPVEPAPPLDSMRAGSWDQGKETEAESRRRKEKEESESKSAAVKTSKSESTKR